jgi:ectoine hydroxylase-related dioxygenase (phytanoyl-CoA dioxygenase family)
MSSGQEFVRPFPALTPAQRLRLDVYGYVVVPGALTADEVGQTREALQRLKREILANGGQPVRGASFALNKPHHHFIGAIHEADPTLTAYITHPRLVGMAEELMGCEARITECNAHINSRVPGYKLGDPPEPQFHRGVDIDFGSHSVNGLYHCNFVKTLTNLTDLGPDDGGTVVIAGSHKTNAPPEDMITCAQADPSLIHQVIAPAGSTLLFNETLIHGTGQIRSDNERVIIICGYSPRMYPMWDGAKMSPEFQKRVPESLKTLFFGKAHWNRAPRYRKLSDPVDSRPVKPVEWPERPRKDSEVS